MISLKMLATKMVAPLVSKQVFFPYCRSSDADVVANLEILLAYTRRLIADSIQYVMINPFT